MLSETMATEALTSIQISSPNFYLALNFLNGPISMMPEPRLRDGNGGYWAKNQLGGISFVLFMAGAGKVPAYKHQLTPVPCFRTLNKHHELVCQGLFLVKWIIIEGMFFSSVAREPSLFQVCLNSTDPYVRLLTHIREYCSALGVVWTPNTHMSGTQTSVCQCSEVESLSNRV